MSVLLVEGFICTLRILMVGFDTGGKVVLVTIIRMLCDDSRRLRQWFREFQKQANQFIWLRESTSLEALLQFVEDFWVAF